jgi:cysteinyl-tRNA synthetase
MQFYNSLTRRKEEFVPGEAGKTYIYVCGITAYDYCHIGHARAAVVFDVLVRFLRHLNYEVTFVRNFTDVDDKIINRSREEDISADEVAEKYIRAYYEDMRALAVLPADLEPRATEHIGDMQALIRTLLDKGYAYSAPSGDVYFRVRLFRDYGRLSGRDVEELKSGARIEPGDEKEDPLDFALWKRAKEGEPAWDSPWGQGRPGWHIECSAMSGRFLPLPLDIHGGGQDLIFPHHENERAQSMAAHDREFARYWMHNGFVRVRSEKMSKSLGNFVTIRDILGHYLPEVMRFFLLGKHYRSPLDFDWDRLEETEKALKRLYQTKGLLQQALQRDKWSATPLPEDISRELDAAADSWRRNLEDDLNTAGAVGDLFTLIRLANRMLEDKQLRRSEQSRQAFSDILRTMETVSDVLGILGQDSSAFLARLRDTRAARKNIDAARVEELLQERANARREKRFERADEIRDELAAMGVELRDTPEGTVWDVE